MVSYASGDSLKPIELSDEWQFRFLEIKPGNKSYTPFISDTLFRNAEKVGVPHSFNLKETLGKHRVGFGLYGKRISIPEDFNKRDIFLKFEGVCLRSKVYIDSLLIDSCDFAYMPFSVDLTPYVTPGKETTLSVLVDNCLIDNQIPDRNANGWWIYGGIVREVFLVSMPKQRLDKIRTRTYFRGAGDFRLDIDWRVIGTPPDSVRVRVLENNGTAKFLRTFAFAKNQNCLTAEISGVHPWNPDDPYLYELELTPFYNRKPSEPVRIKRGFAQFAACSTSLCMNGQQIFLRGVGRHEVLGDKGPLLTRQERLRDLMDLKALNANSLRIAHFPQHRDIYELCDSLGLLVMDEIPVWKTKSGYLTSNAGKAFAVEYMNRLIEHHANYACIAMWSIGNEFNTLKSSIADFVKYTADETHRLDPSRPVTYCNYMYQFDKAYDYVDIISINEYFGWYLGSLSLLAPMVRQIRKEWPGKPVIIGEFGAQALIGERNLNPQLASMVTSPFVKDISVDHQSLYLSSHIDTLWSVRDICKGIFVWCFNDCMAPREAPHTVKMIPGLNAMGLIDYQGRKKPAFGIVQKKFSDINRYMHQQCDTIVK